MRATDEAGNTDATPASYTWTVDTLGPDAPTITDGPDDPTNSNSATFEWTGAESGGHFECKVDAGAFAFCTSPEPYGALTEDHHKFSVRQVDAAGNEGAVAEYEWDTDYTEPNTTIDAQPSDPSNDATPTFEFSGTDNHSAPADLDFECNVDGLGWNPCNSPETLAALSDDSHTFQVRATDEAGNTDATPASYTWTVDTLAPDAPTITSPAEGSFHNTPRHHRDRHGRARLDGGDLRGRDEPRHDDGERRGSGARRVTRGDDGSHTYTAKATDAATNTSGASAIRARHRRPVKPRSPRHRRRRTARRTPSPSPTRRATTGRAGLDKVELYAKGPSDATFALAGTDSTPNTTQSFAFTATGDGSYGFYTRRLRQGRQHRGRAGHPGRHHDRLTTGLRRRSPSPASSSRSTTCRC